MKLTNRIFVVRPSGFGFNPETAESNRFQNEPGDDETSVSEKALFEFDRFVDSLRNEGVSVVVAEEPDGSVCSDAVFPNNWFSVHPDGSLFLYPMASVRRRLERSLKGRVVKETKPKSVHDISHFENEGKYLEGTGSLVLDHDNRLAFACFSERTDAGVLEHWSRVSGYEVVAFHSSDEDRVPIYHTNVMMCLGKGFAVVCLDSVVDRSERKNLETRIRATGRIIVSITHEQMSAFAGNMLQIADGEGRELLVMSKTALSSLTELQKELLTGFSRLLDADVSTIERIGGGSVRCMMAELWV
ncbi:MAG: arginine deiminase-related protein [Pyrinomonadaceae bacterium]